MAKSDEEDNKKEEAQDLSLDQVHDKVVADLENSGEEEGDDDEEDKSGDNTDDSSDDDKDESDAADGDDEEDKGEGGSDNDSDGGDGEDDSGEDEKADDDAGSGAADDVDSNKEEDDQPAAKLDTDTTKNGPGKISVRDYDGEVHYFNSLDEVPEDFEPKSYKEWGRAVQLFTDKEQTDRANALEAEKKAADEAKAARIKAIKDDWDRDIASLTDEGKLPKDKKERQPVVDAVFDIMNSKLARGKVIDFETGYEIYAGQESSKDKKDKQEKTASDKKKRGGMVVGAGAGTSPASKPRIIEGPPAGVTLDDVHENVLGSL